MDKKLVGAFLITLIAIIFTVSLIRYDFSQLNQTGNIPSPSPEPTPKPSPSEEPTGLDSIPKPSIPEFTVNFAQETWPLYQVSPSTGKKEIVDEDYYKGERYIEVKIKNQQVPPTSTRLINYTNLYYGIRLKEHHEDDWNEAPRPRYYGYHNASDADYTIITLYVDDWGNGIWDVPDGGKVDVQVQALIGQDNRIPVMTIFGESSKYDFVGEESGWSNTQTLKIP